MGNAAPAAATIGESGNRGAGKWRPTEIRFDCSAGISNVPFSGEIYLKKLEKTSEHGIHGYETSDLAVTGYTLNVEREF